MFSLKSIFCKNDTSKVLDINKKQFDSLKYEGVRALRTGHMEYAVKCFQQALKISDDLEIWDYLSQTYIGLGQFKDSYECLQYLANIQSNNEKIFQRMANVAYMSEDYDAEQASSLKLLELNPNSAIGHFLLAQSYIGKSNLVLGIAMLSKAIMIDTNFFSAILLRGQTLLKIGDLAGATSDVDLLLEKFANYEDVLLLAAHLAKAKNDQDEAIKYYNRLIDINPFSVIALRERGLVKLDKGDIIGAEEDARAALEIEPNQVANINGNYFSYGNENSECKKHITG